MESESYHLIGLLYIDYEKEINNNRQIGSTAEEQIEDLTDLVLGDSVISRIIDCHEEYVDIVLKKKDHQIKFGNVNYKKFKEYIIKLSESDEFGKRVTSKFLEIEVFKWLINIKVNARVEQSLFNFLNDRIEKKKRDEIFYFPIINLEIEKPFKIGYVEFTYFTSDYWDKLVDKSSSMKELFDDTFRGIYLGKVLAVVHVKGVADNVEELAKKHVEIAIDTLKLLGPTIYFPKKHANFDLDYRLNYQIFTDYFTRHSNNDKKFTLVKNSKFYPTRFTLQIIDDFQEENKKFSDFILSERDVEIDKLIRQSINIFANCLTLNDLHLRIAHIFILVESVCLEDDRENKITAKIMARIPKLLTQNFKDKEYTKLIFSEFYEIRHNFVHKAKRLSINIEDLGKFQYMIKYLILRLIDNRHLLNKKNLFKVLDEIKT